MWASSSGGEILQGVRESPSLKEVTLVGTGMMLANTFSFPDRVNLLPDGSFLILQTDNHPHLVHGRTIRDLCPENPAWQVYYTASVVEDDGNVWIGTNLHGLFCTRFRIFLDKKSIVSLQTKAETFLSFPLREPGKNASRCVRPGRIPGFLYGR